MENEYEFDEIRARKIVNSLLKKDSIVFRRLIPDIEKLDSLSFENLFNGEVNFEYNIKNKNIFKKLLIKFDNFLFLLYDWYKSDKYYPYLEELWINYPCLEDLKIISEEKELEEKLKKYSINYNNWPPEIKKSFREIINQTEGTRALEFKNEIEDKFSQVYNLIEELRILRDAHQEEGDKIYVSNSNTLILGIISSVIPILGGTFINKAINDKNIRLVNKIINQKCFISQKEKASFSKGVLKCIEKKKLTGKYDFYDAKKRLHKLNIKCKNGKLDLQLGQKVRAIFKSKLICGMHAALSFLNLGWSVYELRKTYNEFEKVEMYKRKLKEISKLFEIHKNEIGILPEDFNEATSRIRNVYNKIKEDLKCLKELMKEIKKSIEFQKSQKNKSIVGLATSIGLGAFGVIGGIVTCNGVSVAYGISTVANIISGVCHGTNLSMSCVLIDKFNEVLEEAEKEEQLIQDEIDLLINELMERVKLDPKFDLNTSFSSISTNL